MQFKNKRSYTLAVTYAVVACTKVAVPLRGWAKWAERNTVLLAHLFFTQNTFHILKPFCSNHNTLEIQPGTSIFANVKQ